MTSQGLPSLEVSLTPPLGPPNGLAGEPGWRLAAGLLISFLPLNMEERCRERVMIEINLVGSCSGSPYGLCLLRNYQCA